MHCNIYSGMQLNGPGSNGKIVFAEAFIFTGIIVDRRIVSV
jgi:hypothetical protein